MSKLDPKYLKIIFLNILLFLFGCHHPSPDPDSVDKDYNENLSAKRKHLFHEFDTGRKFDKGSLNVILTSAMNLNTIKDISSDTLKATNSENTINSFYQNSTIYETTNTTSFRLLYQYSNSVGIGIGGSISNGNKNVINIPTLSENMTDLFFSLRFGLDLDENTHAILESYFSSYNLKSAFEIIELNDQSEVYSYTTDFTVPDNRLTFALNKKMNEYNHLFIGVQTINRIYKLDTRKNIERYYAANVYVQNAIKSISSEMLLYGYLGWEGSIKRFGQNNTLSICFGYPFFNEKPISGGLTLGIKLTTDFLLPSQN
jgi:hypothetical protein